MCANIPGLAGSNNGGSDECSLRYTHAFEPGLSNILEIQHGGILWIFFASIVHTLYVHVFLPEATVVMYSHHRTLLYSCFEHYSACVTFDFPVHHHV